MPIDLNNFVKKVDELIFHLDDVEGSKLFKVIQKGNLVNEIRKDENEEIAYKALQFLVIPYLEINQIVEVIKNDLYVGFNIDLDIKERITKALLFLDLFDRDDFKEAIKRSLLLSDTIITKEVITNDNRKIRTIADWLKDYVANTGVRERGTLEEAQYFYKQMYIKMLSNDEKNILKKLFDLYKFLNTSSLTPEGFEDDLLLRDENGRILSTNKGKIIVLFDPRNNIISQKPKIRNINWPPKTQGEKKIEVLKQAKESYSQTGLEKMAIEEEIVEEKEIEDLKVQASRFQPGSLERKAIEEEISRLNR